MINPEETQTTTENSWFVIRIAYRIAEMVQRRFSWLFPTQVAYPENESGELMRRALAHKSWFDLLSSKWVEQSFSVKMTVLAGVALFSISVGLWVGIPVLLTLSSLFVFAGAHVLLVAHEHQRIERAKIFAEEAIELNEDLEASKKLLDEAVSAVNYVADELTAQSARMKENANVLEKESQELHEEKELLSIRADEIKTTTIGLIAQEKEVHKVLDQAFEHLQTLDTGLTQTTDHVQGIGDTIVQFSESVQGIQTSQLAYAEAVNRFGIFVAEQKTPVKPRVQRHFDKRTGALEAELYENELLIAQMKSKLIN